MTDENKTSYKNLTFEEVSDLIYNYIGVLADQRKLLKAAGEEKAKGIAEYHLAKAKWSMILKAGKEVELEGETIKNAPVTIIPAISKGKCWNELYQKELAEANYKSIVVQIECLKAEMCALQSIKRVQEIIAT